MNYGHKKQTSLTFVDAVEKTKSELAKEDFGILTEIDVKATLKKKLNVDFDNYVILGACIPPSHIKHCKTKKTSGSYCLAMLLCMRTAILYSYQPFFRP